MSCEDDGEDEMGMQHRLDEFDCGSGSSSALSDPDTKREDIMLE